MKPPAAKTGDPVKDKAINNSRFKTTAGQQQQLNQIKTKNAVAQKAYLNKLQETKEARQRLKEDKYTNWRQKANDESISLEARGRIHEEGLPEGVSVREAMLDEYFNPFEGVYGMAANLAAAPLEAQQTNSNMPYVVAIGIPLLTGLVSGFGAGGGVGTTTTTQLEQKIVTSTEKALVQENRIAGNAFRDELAYGLKQEGREIRTEVYKSTPFGKRYIDIEVSYKGKVMGGIETKLGGSPYTPLQRLKDFYLEKVHNYPVNLVRGKRN